MNQDLHIPVLLTQVIETLDPQKDRSYLDLTAGYGGHASEIMKRLGRNSRTTLVDRDIYAVEYLRSRFNNDPKATIVHGDFLSVSEELCKKRQEYDYILADIGLSSPHLDNPDRGFSFMNDGPLDMRMDVSNEITAAQIVNKYAQEELAKILYEYGELHKSRQIADVIIEHRPYQTTSELAAVISGTHKQRIRTLAQVFQALRIAVNDELKQLSSSLPLWHRLLSKEGKLAVITFHSLEDRIVKQYFQEHGASTYESELKILTKRPLIASPEETAINPRARSAKLRVVQRK